MLATSAVALALAGCAVSDGSGQTALEAQRSLDERVNRIQDVLGGTWSVLDDPTPRGCTIPLGVEGELYPALRIGAAPRDLDATLGRLVQHWADDGLAPVTTSVGVVTELQVRGQYGDLIVVRVSESAITIQAEGECRPTAPASLAGYERNASIR